MTEITQRINAFFAPLRVLSGAQLKLIAIISMLLDHTNKALIYPYLNGGILLVISDILDVLGRIAFPIFCFMLIEGFYKTRSRLRYLLNLLVFGVISEVPFDMFTVREFFNPNWNNIMFTLAFVLVTVWAVDALKNKLPRALWFIVSFLIVGASCLAVMFTGMDYEHHAVLIGYFFYLFYSVPALSVPFGFASMYKEPWALLGFGLVLCYNGERGKQHKWLNYWFYPVHMLILGILRMILNI